MGTYCDSENRTLEIEFDRANKMPAITWHWLKMNHATIEVPDGLAICDSVSVSNPRAACGAADAFDNAMDDAQRQWEAKHPAPTAEELAARAEFMAAEADATYGGTAQSAYQSAAQATEDARSLALSFANGTGTEVAAYLRSVSGDPIVVEAQAGQTVNQEVIIQAESDSFSAAAIDVIADTGSVVNLDVLLAGPALNPSEFKALSNAFGATTLRVFADAGSTVTINRIQVFPAGVTDIDDMGIFAGENASVKVSQRVLGGAANFTGVATDLRGDGSALDIETNYLGRDEQKLDFNYIVRHHGERTDSNLVANGVLTGASHKTLRGTIDFVRGCKGAMGSENETVLLVDEKVRNKTIPTMLCNEDDVAGNHGATIGHVGDEQMFYLASRGLDTQAAERMFATAMLENTYINATSPSARAAVQAFGCAVDPTFKSLIELEAENA